MKTLVTCLLGLCLVLASCNVAARKKHVHHDEITLSPRIMRQLQANLVAGGYLRGPLSGQLTRRARRALRAFQREYHLPRTGDLDLATAEGLLGHDVLSAFLVAKR